MRLEHKYDCLSHESALTFTLLHKDKASQELLDKLRETEDEAVNNFSRIRCPACAWQPKSWSRWQCVDCAAPEWYFAGCGTSWNTFQTGGRCPGCNHHWRYTLCLRCNAFPLHEDWYAEK